MLENPEPRRWTIQSHTGPRAISRQTRRALEALGYRIVPANRKAAGNQGIQEPDLWLVDEGQLAGGASPNQDSNKPIVLLTGSRPQPWQDPRIIARIRRPPQLQDLYCSFQSALEAHPRRVPRVATQIPARCIRSDQRWPAAIVSLSEGGCLVRVSEPFDLGTRMNLQFAIPMNGIVSTRAECLYQGERGLGLAFSETSVRDRQDIRDFVLTSLAVLSTPAGPNATRRP